MNTERLLCDSCGAPLEIPEAANFVTCQHCETALSVKRDESVHYTQTLEDIYEKTQELGERIDAISGWHEVEALDRKWEMDRQQLLKPGERLTTVPETVMRFAYCVLIGLGFMIAAMIVWPPYTFCTLLLLPIIGRAIYLEARAHNYRNAEKGYLQKRQALLQQLQN